MQNSKTKGQTATSFELTLFANTTIFSSSVFEENVEVLS